MSDLFTPAALSVSELNALVRSLLEQNLFGLWVAGEVSNLTRAASGHYYFSLKDSRAQVRCALFKGAATRLAAPLNFGPRDTSEPFRARIEAAEPLDPGSPTLIYHGGAYATMGPFDDAFIPAFAKDRRDP